MNILYVEDDPNDAALVALYAQARQHKLTVATRRSDVQNALGSDLDLILIDLVLNNAREGYAIMQSLRDQGYKQPVIAVTGLATPQDQADCRNAGFDTVLTKPYTITQLDQIISQYVR